MRILVSIILMLLAFGTISVPLVLAEQVPSSASLNQVSSLSLPSSDGKPLEVQVAFQLRNINLIDDQSEKFQFSGVLTLIWQDPRQAFNPAEELVSEKIYQGNSQVNELSTAWYPQVVLVNDADQYETQGILLRVLPDGTSILTETINAIAKGNLKMKRYPFDSQQLMAVFEVFGFDQSQVELKLNPKLINSFADKIRISQWELLNLRSEIDEINVLHTGVPSKSSTFNVIIDLKRQSFFMLRLVVFPLVLLVMLSWSVFWMDRSSLGDRVNISFIGILTVVTYQIVLSGILPHIAYVTLMTLFLNISFLIMALAVVMNLVVSHCDRLGKNHRGDLIDRRCRLIFPLLYFGSLSLILMFF